MPFDLRSVLLLAVGGALAATVVTIAALELGLTEALLSADSVRIIVVIRAIAITLVLGLVLPALVRRRLRRAQNPVVRTTAIVGSAAAYALNPFSWNGRAYIGQLVMDPGLATMILDLLLWVLLGVLAITWWARRGAADVAVS